jgi:CheY-like chemotaxis protein
MSRILVVDDSPHAQRMGERILRDEGYEVITVSNADSALIRLEDADPDVVVADVVMPGRTGYDICQYLRMSPRHRHVRVILTSGAQEPMDAARAQFVQADGAIEKPFEASALLGAVKPLAEAAQKERPGGPGQGPDGVPAASAGRSQRPGAQPPTAPFVAVVDGEQVRAAVTLALDAAMGTMVEEIARRVLATLKASRPEAQPSPAPPQPLPPQLPPSAIPPPAHSPREMVRHVLRVRRGSILGLDIDNPEPDAPDSQPPE